MTLADVKGDIAADGSVVGAAEEGVDALVGSSRADDIHRASITGHGVAAAKDCANLHWAVRAATFSNASIYGGGDVAAYRTIIIVAWEYTSYCATIDIKSGST